MKQVKNDPNIVGVFAFYDIKAKLYDLPFYAQSELFAVRRYKILAKDSGTMLCEFMEDYDLYQVATYNKEFGTFEFQKRLILRGKEFKNEISNEA